jgi:hypothetical protein
MSNHTRRILAMAAGLALAATLACGGDGNAPTGPQGPTAGTLTVSLTTPNNDDGAILLTVSGPDMTQLASADASLYFRHAQAGTTITAVLVGDVAGGDLVTFHVPDVDAAGSYSATIQQVADRSNALRGSLTGYSLTVE